MNDPRDSLPGDPQRPDQPATEPGDPFGQPDLDARFAEIVARWGEEADLSGRTLPPLTSPAQGPGPASPAPGAEPAGDLVDRPVEDGPAVPAGSEPQPAAAPGEEASPGPPPEPVVVWRGITGSPTLDEEEEHYIPPPPEPLPAGDLHFWGILVGLVGGPLLLLYLMIFGRDLPGWWLMLAVGLSAGGFALLVSRLPARRDEDDDDNGARI